MLVEGQRQKRMFRRHTSRWSWFARLAPKFARRLQLFLYDPVVVAEMTNFSGCSVHPHETPLALIAHWD